MTLVIGAFQGGVVRSSSMPLLLLCGLPASGKSSRVKEFVAFAQEQGKKVIVFSHETLDIPRSTAYAGTLLCTVPRGIHEWDGIIILTCCIAIE